MRPDDPYLITGRTARLPGDYAPVTDDEIRRAVQYSPGSVAPAACRCREVPPLVSALLPPGAVAELEFDPPRRWRFDFAWPQARVALEIDGGIWTRGRHTRGKGYRDDIEKLNRAAELGWAVVRGTPEDLDDGSAGAMVARVIASRRAFR